MTFVEIGHQFLVDSLAFRVKNSVRTERVSHVSQAAAYVKGSELTLVDADGTSYKKGVEADLAPIKGVSARMIRYSSRIPLKETGPIASAVQKVGKILPESLQVWPFATAGFRQQLETHTTENGVYGLAKLLLPPRLQRRAWATATEALHHGSVSVVGNSNMLDGRMARALHRYAQRKGLGSERVTFIHVK